MILLACSVYFALLMFYRVLTGRKALNESIMVFRGSGWGVTNISCQLKLWPFVSYQLNFRPFVSCQLMDY